MPGLMVFERGGGTYMYSPLHIMWLASAAALCLWSALMARRHGRAACRAVGMTLLCAESARVLALYIGGRHICRCTCARSRLTPACTTRRAAARP